MSQYFANVRPLFLLLHAAFMDQKLLLFSFVFLLIFAIIFFLILCDFIWNLNFLK